MLPGECLECRTVLLHSMKKMHVKYWERENSGIQNMCNFRVIIIIENKKKVRPNHFTPLSKV